jgi:hypothetical protein
MVARRVAIPALACDARHIARSWFVRWDAGRSLTDGADDEADAGLVEPAEGVVEVGGDSVPGWLRLDPRLPARMACYERRDSSALTRATPARISTPPPICAPEGTWPRAAHASSAANRTSDMPANDASFGPRCRIAMIPAV